MPLNPGSRCPCATGLTYGQCCQPYISGQRFPATARQLMRARYTAHVAVDIDYLLATWQADARRGVDREQVAAWAAQSQWLGLEVVGDEQDDNEGWVEFIATYRHRGELRFHHERSRFRRQDGQWYFVNGEVREPQSERRGKVEKAEKVGRNDPCPCGSGKKHKRCCG